MFCRDCVNVTELTRNYRPVLRQPDPGRGKGWYAAGQCLPLLRTMGKHPVLPEQALIRTPDFSEAFFHPEGHLDGSSSGLAIFEGLVLLCSEELGEEHNPVGSGQSARVASHNAPQALRS